MKSKSYLSKQYETQKAQFELAKEHKVKNLESDEANIRLKIDSLQQHLDELTRRKEKIQKEEFQSFEEFFRKIEEQSKSSKEKNQRG